MSYPISNEQRRLRELYELEILDTPPEAAFDRIVDCARELFEVPYALISFVDADRQWFKAGARADFHETPRDFSFCNYTILHDSVFVVPDATKNSSLSDNPYVTGEPHIRFYAGAPLITQPGIRVGTLCVIDTEPRQLSAHEADLLAAMARMVVSELWLREALLSKGRGAAPPSSPQDQKLPIAALLTGQQIRAARGLLNWSIADLAQRSGVSFSTVRRFEADVLATKGNSTTAAQLRKALEDGGVYFVGNRAVGIQPRHEEDSAGD